MIEYGLDSFKEYDEKAESNTDEYCSSGTGYVGLSIAVLLSQHNAVKAADIIPGKVE